MKFVRCVLANSREAFFRSLSLLALLMLAGVGGVSAQSSPALQSTAPRPPVSVNGWRYELRAPDVHMFYCEKSDCGAKSRVSYRLYAPGNSMSLEQFREEQEQIVKVLEQRTPGQRISILAIDGDRGTSVPRMFKARRLMVKPDGTNEYQVSGWLFGARGTASVISSSASEKSSNDNYTQFAAGVMIVLTSASR